MISRPSASFPLFFQIVVTADIPWHGTAVLSKRHGFAPAAVTVDARPRRGVLHRLCARTHVRNVPWRGPGSHARPAAECRGWEADVSQVPWDILIVLLIVFVGGFFAAAEMALVSLREGQVR